MVLFEQTTSLRYILTDGCGSTEPGGYTWLEYMTHVFAKHNSHIILTT